MNKELNEGFENLEWKSEYFKNQSRRNNIKITGVPEEEEEKTWDDTEAIVKNLISDKLGIEGELRLKELTASGRSRETSPNTTSQEPRAHSSIIAEIKSWKTITKTSSELQEKKKPRGVVCMDDFSKRTSERRRSKIEARRNGKTTFMVMDQLVIFDKLKVTDKSFDDTDDEVTSKVNVVYT